MKIKESADYIFRLDVLSVGNSGFHKLEWSNNWMIKSSENQIYVQIQLRVLKFLFVCLFYFGFVSFEIIGIIRNNSLHSLRVGGIWRTVNSSTVFTVVNFINLWTHKNSSIRCGILCRVFKSMNNKLTFYYWKHCLRYMKQ